MEDTVKLLILVIASLVVLTEGDAKRNLRSGQGRQGEGFAERSYRFRRNGMGKWRGDQLRSHEENQSDSYKSSFGQLREDREGRRFSLEEEYYKKASRDALIGKNSDKTRRKLASFDGFNVKNHRSGEHEEEKRSAHGYRMRKVDNLSSQRSHSPGEMDDFTVTNRQKKLKKHGGFLPLPAPKERKPNIILILTDDQDVELGSLNFMPKTLRLLRDGGAEFRHAYVTTPMCCPSRSSLLTGMYVHNHNVFTNNENCSNIQWQQTHETRTFATYLSNAGYRTGYFGKYLNKYNGSYIPPGWREWGGLIMNSRYYNYSINMNGKKIKHGWDYHKDYYTDLIANDSVAFLRQSKQYFSKKPVMLVVSFPAPHGPEDSAPQFHEMFLNVTTHHTPSYDFAPNPDKQWILQVTNKMQNIHKQFTDMLMTKRLQTLQSVDLAVERIYQELKNIGELENTYIIYTSDHGYHLGQFGLVKGKSFPFEFDIRVPFLVRGPGVEPGTLVEDIVLNIDLAPTFLDIAGVEPPLHMDGRSIVRLLHNRQSKRRKVKWPDTFLIESPGRREVPQDVAASKKVRQNKNKFKNFLRINKEKGTSTQAPEVDFKHFDNYGTTEANEMMKKNYGEGALGESFESDTEEDFNEDEENDETEDNGSSLLAQENHFKNMPLLSSADSQVDNKISALNQQFGGHGMPKSARLAVECKRPDMQSPCQPSQKWYCVAEGGRWRKHKCKFQRNCICSTPKGFLYAKIENYDRTAHRHFYEKTDRQYLDVFRNRRMAHSWSSVPDTVNYSTLLSLINRSNKLKQRRKRENSEDDISVIVDDLEHELSEAEETEISLNSTVILGEEPVMSRCSVTAFGQVNCSNIVYRDFSVWKRSRDEIEAKIKSLKLELEALKEIRKHLRERRPDVQASFPVPTTEYDAGNSSAEAEYTLSNVNDPATTETYDNSFTSESYISVGGLEMTEDLFNVSGTEESEAFESTVDFEVSSTPAASVKKWRSNKNKTNEDGSMNRIDAPLTDVNRGKDKCVCALEGQDLLQKNEAKELAKEARRRIKEERLRKKERKLKKKAKMEKECLSEKMNCFNHDNEHWRTPPLWTEGPFCFCMNANNNSYSCLRTINSTHNFLYCEFTTGFRTFYNLRLDPFEQLNRISTLTVEETNLLSNQLAELKACKGARQCSLGMTKDAFLPNSYNSRTLPAERSPQRKQWEIVAFDGDGHCKTVQNARRFVDGPAKSPVFGWDSVVNGGTLGPALVRRETRNELTEKRVEELQQ